MGLGLPQDSIKHNIHGKHNLFASDCILCSAWPIHIYQLVDINGWHGRLWLRGRASILLSEGCWCDSPGLHVQVSLGKILNPKTGTDVLDCTAATAIIVWMNEVTLAKASAKCKCTYTDLSQICISTRGSDMHKYDNYFFWGNIMQYNDWQIQNRSIKAQVCTFSKRDGNKQYALTEAFKRSLEKTTHYITHFSDCCALKEKQITEFN